MWLMILSMVALAPPSPLDAFRANFSSIKAELDYEFCQGHLSGPLDQVWLEQKPAFVETLSSKVIGHWACDGEVELYRFSSPDDILEEAKRERPKIEAGKAQFKTHFVPKTELLWDGRVLAVHRLEPHSWATGDSSSWDTISLSQVDRKPSPLVGAHGPFAWGFNTTFPYLINEKFAAVEPVWKSGLIGGRPVMVGVYMDRSQDGVVQRLELSFDPTIGYLPRFARLLSYSEEGGPFISREMYISEATRCSAGGFIPTEFYVTDILGDNFVARFPNYDVDTMLFSKEAVFNCGRMRSSAFRDLSMPAAMTDINGVKRFVAPGGWQSLPRSSRLTLTQLKKYAGSLLTNPSNSRVLPSLDATELHAYDAPKDAATNLSWRLMLFFVVSSTTVGVVIWKRLLCKSAAKCLLLVSCLTSLAGCSDSSAQVIKLNAAFTETTIYTEPDRGEVSLSLLIRNDGNVPMRISKVDGGCNCRRVDQSRLPRTIYPKQFVDLSVHMITPQLSHPQTANFEIETDHGLLNANVPFFILVSHQFNPNAVSHTALKEREPWSFKFVHRVIYTATHEAPPEDLVIPPQFRVERNDTKTGKIGGDTRFLYRDTEYSISLEDSGLGLHRQSIRVNNDEHHSVLELPVVWERLPFLSTSPDRVVIGSRPVRVFLRCVDDSVELIRVLKVPPGVRATISSTRELLVSLLPAAPVSIDGTIEIETSVTGHKPILLPIVRYGGQPPS